MPFRLYIDETGDHTFKSLDTPDKRYLGLTGLVIEDSQYRLKFQPELESFKQKHFPHDPDNPLILHRKEIINRRGIFCVLLDPTRDAAFKSDLLSFLSKQDFTLVTVVIDKKAHIERYGDAAFHPYHYCVGALLERYCGFLRNVAGAKGDVLAESRGKEENLLLMAAYEEILTLGTLHRNSSFYKQVLTSREIKFKPKTANIAGLQVVDLLAHPLKEDILEQESRITKKRSDFAKQICTVTEKKYNRRLLTSETRGYGKVFLK